MQFSFNRIAIINRGEPAMRLIRAVRELNAQYSCDLQVIALYTEPDANAMFVREADISYCLGSATFIDATDGFCKNTYVNLPILKKALIETQAQAAWVGWGFVSEDPLFADMCLELNVCFIGPSGKVMRRLGDKIASKILAEEANVPVSEWSGGAVENVASAKKFASILGCPLMLKATAGGGGRGIRRINSIDDIDKAFESAQTEASKAFGNGTLFLEKMVLGARHIEVQIVADMHGNTWAAGVRDCTIQRKNQKVIEEAPSPALNEMVEADIRAAAIRIAKRAEYTNVGTVEFLFCAATAEYYFMEMNTRLQVEHPVTELVTGIDLVKMQLRIANGEVIPVQNPKSLGHAIEVRLNAEDPDNGFAPSPGAILQFVSPAGSGIRIDSGVTQGDVIPNDFDSMVAKILAVGHSRDEAISKLVRALSESAVIIKGGTTNKSFLLELLKNPDYIACNTDINWLDKMWQGSANKERPYMDIALLAAAIEAALVEYKFEHAEFLNSAHKGRAQVLGGNGIAVELEILTQVFQLSVQKCAFNTFMVSYNNVALKVLRSEYSPGLLILECNGKKFRAVCANQGHSFLIEINGYTHVVSRDDGGRIRSPAAAVVLLLAVKVGDVIAAGDKVAVLEAMKMETTITSPIGGRVKEILTGANMQIAAGAPIVIIEKNNGAASTSDKAKPLSLAVFASADNTNVTSIDYAQALEQLTQFCLGFEINKSVLQKLLEVVGTLNGVNNTKSAFAAELTFLQIFSDIASLFYTPGKGSDEQWHSGPDCFANFIRTFDVKSKTLPPIFIDNLKTTLAWYKVGSTSHTPALEEASLLLYKAFLRLDKIVEITALIIAKHLNDAKNNIAIPPEFMPIIDKIILITQNNFEALNSLAHLYKYRIFDELRLNIEAQVIFAEFNDTLDKLLSANNVDIEALQNAAEYNFPYVRQVINQLSVSSPLKQQCILEILSRYFYRDRDFKERNFVTINSHVAQIMRYAVKDKDFELITTGMPYNAFFEQIGAVINQYGKEVPLERNGILLDFYLWGDFETLQNGERIRDNLQQCLLSISNAKQVKRICVAVAGNNVRSKEQYFTFVLSETGTYTEDTLSRNIHPMVAKRFELWRYLDFTLDRLTSVSDEVFLFKATSKHNKKDTRLLAFVEISDITAHKITGSRAVEYPGFERKFIAACMAMRETLSQINAKEAPKHNLLSLFVSTPLTGQQRDIGAIARRILPFAVDLHLEKVSVKAKAINKLKQKLEDLGANFSYEHDTGFKVNFTDSQIGQISSLTPYEQRRITLRERGLFCPYEIINTLKQSSGIFEELDLASGSSTTLTKVVRNVGENTANIVIGTITNHTQKFPGGMTRVIIVSCPVKDMGSLSEPECLRIILALDLAEKLGLPVEWFATSSGAKIAMNSGTENLDWTARVLKHIIEFTQKGCTINMVVTGINVGAQAYWDAEATMHMHTKGILIMLPNAAMVLTGKKALDYSGSVSAENNAGIGGFEAIMGPNGQAQFLAESLVDACKILLQYEDISYVLPNDKAARRAKSFDSVTRNICEAAHPTIPGCDFVSVGDVFSDEKNSGRKKPFSIRAVMQATIDVDLPYLERWQSMRNAETAVVWESHIGGFPVCLLGVESKPLLRYGVTPGDGPDSWTGGTLFPNSSKKLARAINSASGNRPVVMLANLSGFDGSPESMRTWQLEYGAELGRAMVNCLTPIVVVVLTRFHGGAYVVLSQALNPKLKIAAVQGSFASVIGGTPAAAVVFPGEVKARTFNDTRIKTLQNNINSANSDARPALIKEFDKEYKKIYLEKQSEVALEFDKIHSVERALAVGSISNIIAPQNIREFIIASLEKSF